MAASEPAPRSWRRGSRNVRRHGFQVSLTCRLRCAFRIVGKRSAAPPAPRGVRSAGASKSFAYGAKPRRIRSLIIDELGLDGYGETYPAYLGVQMSPKNDRSQLGALPKSLDTHTANH